MKRISNNCVMVFFSKATVLYIKNNSEVWPNDSIVDEFKDVAILFQKLIGSSLKRP